MGAREGEKGLGRATREVTKYRLVHDGGEVEFSATVSAGGEETLVVPAGIERGTVQAVDEAGNRGRSLSFDLVTGTIGGQRLMGRKLALRDNSDPTLRRLKWQAKDVAFVLPSGSDSPTVAGASLEVVNPTTGESAILAMPAAGWTVLASGALRYRDPSQTMGPVRVALRRAGRLAKVVARGSGIGFTLDEPAQGSLAAELQSGTRRYCTLFGGRVRRDQPGRFTAVRAPAPSACVR